MADENSILSSIDARLAGIERSIERQHDENVSEHRRLIDMAEREHSRLHTRISKLSDEMHQKFRAVENDVTTNKTRWGFMLVVISTGISTVIAMIIKRIASIP